MLRDFLGFFPGVYELVTHKVKPGMVPQLEHRMIQGLPARLAEDYPQALAMWYSEFGNPDLCKFNPSCLCKFVKRQGTRRR